MAKFDLIDQLKQGSIDIKELLDLLSIPCRDDELRMSIHDHTVHITGNNTDYTITFNSYDYIVTMAFPSRLTRVQFDYNGNVLQKDYIFSMGKEKMVLSQVNNPRHPKEVTRTFAVMDEDKDMQDATFTKYVNQGRMYQSKESFSEIKKEKDIKRHRVIENPKNLIISNYHSGMMGEIQNQVISTCSPTVPTMFTFTKPVMEPDHMNYLSYYHEPVIMIDGQFDSIGLLNSSLRYQLMILKREGMFDILLTLGDGKERQYFATSYPANEEDLTPKEIGNLMTQFQIDGFLKKDGYPLEETILEELKSIKKDLSEKTFLVEYAKDPFMELLSHNGPFESIMVHVYNNLQRYYDLAHKEVNGTNKKGYYS